MEKIYATILTIGDELLIGQVIDTNSAWIAQELNKIGIHVKQRISVGDVRADIWKALDDASMYSSIVLITGGLGPTADDITKPLLCDYFGGKMVVHQPTLNHITHLFEQVFKRPMIERNRKQAEVPDVCTVLQNEKGTAPGMLFEKEGKFFVAMPGVPHEMKWIMEQHVLARISQFFKTPFIEHRTLLTAGVGESFLAELILQFEEKLPHHIKLAYLPNYGMVRLRLTGWGMNHKALNSELNQCFTTLQSLVKDYLVVAEDFTMQQVIANLLMQHNKTLALAESCTGGYLAHLLTSISGASAYFTGSVVSYANSAKEILLNVSTKRIEQYGAVSEQTALQMAKGIQKALQTNYAIAITGIMGPDGGTADKPVGTVWIAVAGKDTTAHCFQFRFNRERNIQLAAVTAFNLLRKLIIAELSLS
jgi:nicotinamide-nucleotide amidase